MKKSILVLLFPLLATAQQTVNVTIKLNDVQTIVVNGTKNIKLEYFTQSDYQNGVKFYEANHVDTFSTQSYFVKTKALQDNVITHNDVYLNDILQTTQEQILFTNAAGIHSYGVQYGAKGNFEYLNKAKTSYLVQIVYSIEPQ